MPKIAELKKLLLIFLTWRGALYLVSILAPLFLAYRPSFPYAPQLSAHNLPLWLYSWANFDGVHYLGIADNGYLGTALIQAFFPVFPTLIRFLKFGHDTLWAGLILSNLLAFGLVVSFYNFGKKFYAEHAWTGVFFLLTFPTSFYFGAYYTESLFLIFVLNSLLLAQNKKWWWAALLAGLASGTRIVGIFLLPALLAQYLFGNHNIFDLSPKLFKKALKIIKKNWLRLIGLWALSSGGLMTYMFYLWLTFKDPLFFLHVQSEFGAGRQETIITYPQVMWRWLKIMVTARPINLKYWAYFQEGVVGIGRLAILIAAAKRTKLSHLIFCLGAFILPTLTGSFSSMPRYVLISWPIFFFLAQSLGNSKFKYLYFFISTLLLIFNTVLFIQGYWVA